MMMRRAAGLHGVGSSLALRRALVPWQHTPLGATRLLAKKAKGGKAEKAGKGGKGAKGAKGEEEGDEEATEIDLDALTRSMQKSFDYLQRELASVQVGRATPTMLDNVQVSIDGNKMPLPSLAKVLVQGSNALQLSVYEGSHTPAICKAIEMADLNLMPEAVGKTVRVPVPRPTQETRNQLAKQVKKTGESIRVQIRNHRQSGMKEAKAHPAKDVVKRQEKSVQKVHDDFIAKVDAAVQAKEKELTSV